MNKKSVGACLKQPGVMGRFSKLNAKAYSNYQNTFTYTVLLCMLAHLYPLYQCCWMHCMCNMLHLLF